jgi:hypothetical protein
MQENRTPKTIKKIIPLELALIEYTDGNMQNEKAVAIIESGFTNMKPTDPEFRESVKIIDIYRNPPGQWRNLALVSKWLAVAIQNALKESANES